MSDLLDAESPKLLSSLIPGFLYFAQAELEFSKESLTKYREVLKQLAVKLDNPDIRAITRSDVIALKAEMQERGLSVSWQGTTVLILRRLIAYAKDELGLVVMEPSLIRPPKRPHREVIYLTPTEVERFVSVIPLETARGHTSLAGLRFRALVEVLLGTALRISEALSLDISSVDFEATEAKVIGKGGRERVCFFTDRSLYHLTRYLKARTDTHRALFATLDGTARLVRTDLWEEFARYRKKAGIQKPVRPHILRHTAATWLLLNGCPIGHIKEILGHARLETTCRYYLGVDRTAVKAAHLRYSQ